MGRKLGPIDPKGQPNPMQPIGFVLGRSTVFEMLHFYKLASCVCTAMFSLEFPNAERLRKLLDEAASVTRSANELRTEATQLEALD